MRHQILVVTMAARLADALSDQEFATLVGEADTAWPGAPEQHVRLAIILGRDPRFAVRFLEASGSYPPHATGLAASLRTPDEIRRLMEGTDDRHPQPEPLALLIARRGVEAGPLLLAMAEKASNLHAFVHALHALETVEVARYMGDLLDHRELKGEAREYLERSPALAIAALAGSKKHMAKATVEALVRANPSVVEALLPSLDPNARSAVEAIREAACVNVPEAPPELLPRVLREPPWTRKKPKAQKAVTVALTPIAMDERVEWREGQRAEWTLRRWSVQKAADATDALRAAFEKALAGKSAYGVSLYAFHGAEDGVALDVWNRMTLATFGWTEAESVRGLVARFEARGIPGYLAFTVKNAATAAEVFVRIRSPRLAPFYARVLASRTKARSFAQAWLTSFPDEAAAGLIPVALGTDKKGRAQAESAIGYLGHKGASEAVLAIAKRYGDEVVAPVQALLDHDPLDLVPAKMPKLPDWAEAEALPRPLLAGRTHALPLDAVEHLSTMLAFSPLDPAYPGIELVKEACDPQSLLDLSWALFSSWLGADGSSRGDWAMLALAHLGGDEAARRLTPLIRRWPGEAAHARAVKGLDVLAAIGTDVALMHLHGISQKLKFKGLQAKAREKIQQIAEQRELTADELADRLVPDLGLDERGTMVLDFGPRQFTIGFDEQLTPFVLEDGKRKKSLPKPGKSDDAAKAKEASDTWKALKKDVRAIASHQITRLEQLMCSGRRVSREIFQTFFVEHPLLTHLVQRVVWGAFVDGALTATFRVDAERQLMSSDDEPIEIAENAEIGLVHPLLMDDGAKARFGEVFADYELLQPFEQLGRASFEATPEELAANALSRFDGKVAALGDVRGLENRGWVRGEAQDAGIVWDVTKPIPGQPGLAIVVGLEPGFSVAGYDDFADTANQQLSAPTIRMRFGGGPRDGLSLLDAVQLSELIRDLTLITT